MPHKPAPRARTGRPIREQLQEVCNANTVEVARRGFAEIDRHAAGIKGKLRGLGIANADAFVDELTDKVKRGAAELLTGRKQP